MHTKNDVLKIKWISNKIDFYNYNMRLIRCMYYGKGLNLFMCTTMIKDLVGNCVSTMSFSFFYAILIQNPRM